MVITTRPHIMIPLIFSIITAILGIIVLSTTELMEMKTDNNLINFHRKIQIGAYRVCISSTKIDYDECSYMDISCQGITHQNGRQVSAIFFNNDSSCTELKWFRYLFTIALIGGMLNIIFAITTQFSIRPLLPQIIHFSICSTIASMIAMILMITIVVHEHADVKEKGVVKLTYGSILIIICTVLHFCATFAFYRTKRLASPNHRGMTQPLVSTTTTSTVYAPYVEQPISTNGRVINI